MSTDISTVIEIREAEHSPWREPTEAEWEPVPEPGCEMLLQNYDAFGCLFGMKNPSNFTPVADESRFFPEDASDAAREQFAYAEKYSLLVGASWLRWDEIEAVDWDEPANACDERIHCYMKRDDGTLELRGKQLGEPCGPHEQVVNLSDGHTIRLKENEQAEIDGWVYWRRTLRRRDAIDEAWAALFDMMRYFAEEKGARNVRLVVWFTA